MKRRHILAAAGGGVAAGALGFAFYDPTALRFLDVRNRTDRPQTVAVRVVADGEITIERPIELDAGEWRQVPCEWPMPVRTYRYGARFDDDDEWTETSIEESGDACLSISVRESGIELERLEPARSLTCEGVVDTYGEYGTPCEGGEWVRGF